MTSLVLRAWCEPPDNTLRVRALGTTGLRTLTETLLVTGSRPSVHEIVDRWLDTVGCDGPATPAPQG